MRMVTWTLLVTLLLTSAHSLADAEQLRRLINDLQSADTETALKAITGLRESADIRALPPLLDAFRDERDVVRQYAVEALQHLARALDDMHIVVKRWLQSLINRLQLAPSDEMITVEQPVAHSSVARLSKAA